jgi:hypothetical protein
MSYYVMEDQNLLSEVMLIQILLVTLRKENPLQAMCVHNYRRSCELGL